jgi:hypothetical protein
MSDQRSEKQRATEKKSKNREEKTILEERETELVYLRNGPRAAPWCSTQHDAA